MTTGILAPIDCWALSVARRWGGGDRSIECCTLNGVNETTQGCPLQSSTSQKHERKCMSTDQHHTLCNISFSRIQAAHDFFRATPKILWLCASCLVTIKVTTVVSWH